MKRMNHRWKYKIVRTVETNRQRVRGGELQTRSMQIGRMKSANYGQRIIKIVLKKSGE